MVSAFAAHQRLVLGQVKEAERPNEIVALLKRLKRLSIEGGMVNVDSRGSQRESAAAILGKKADPMQALEDNQGTLRDNVERLKRLGFCRYKDHAAPRNHRK
jgi:predicted transposase YbfD/YdcC